MPDRPQGPRAPAPPPPAGPPLAAPPTGPSFPVAPPSVRPAPVGTPSRPVPAKPLSVPSHPVASPAPPSVPPQSVPPASSPAQSGPQSSAVRARLTPGAMPVPPPLSQVTAHAPPPRGPTPADQLPTRVQKLETLGPDELREGWDEEERSALLKAAAPASGVLETVPPPANVPALSLPSPVEVGPLETGPRSSMPPPMPARGERPEGPLGPLVGLLNARIAALTGRQTGGDAAADRRNDPSADRLELARAHLELALADDILDDGSRAAPHAQAALQAEPALVAAHELLRRVRHSRQSPRVLLEHLDREIAAATTDGARADLLAERARVLDAASEKPEVLRAAWERVLAVDPTHAAGLTGLAGVLATSLVSSEQIEALAAHLGRMADAWEREPKLAAWLHVERAHLLDARLGLADGAWDALQRALALDSGVGPVRAACVRHASLHRDAAALVGLLDAEARLERSGDRSARLELDAATIAYEKLGDVSRAIALLERAAARAPTAPLVDRRVLDDLVRLHESAGNLRESLRARRARLAHLTDARAAAHELRTIAAVAERAGDRDAAVADTERALAAHRDDPVLVEELDRRLEAAGGHARRVELWVEEGSLGEDPARRAKALVRAAAICDGLGKKVDAVGHLRTALAVAPADAGALDRLARLLTSAPSEAASAEVRARIGVYTHAAELVADPARRVVYLEKIALLWEEVLGDAPLAAKAYEQILAIEPDRRSAVVGLQRAAARAGDARALARALLDEARVTADAAAHLDLSVRAAEALAPIDAERALALVGEVIAVDPAHEGARALETRIHETAGRWELAAASLGQRAANAKDRRAKAALLMARADIEETRLRAPRLALASLEEAKGIDPAHPSPPQAIVALLEAAGDHRALRDALEAFAAAAATPEERARHLLRAAEIDELRLGDDAAAAALLQRVLDCAPADDLATDRAMRVMARVAPSADTLPPSGPRRTFERAMLIVDGGVNVVRALPLLEMVLAEDPAHLPALRTIEGIARATGAVPLLANALSQQIDAVAAPATRLAISWALASLIEWRLPPASGVAIYDRIRAIAPRDRAAVDASLRRSLAARQKGEAGAHEAAIDALGALLAHAPDATSRLAIHLELALLLESSAAGAPQALAAALAQFRAALAIDSLSITAAAGTARLATSLRDAEAGIGAARALADLARDPKVRARYLLDAAELLLAGQGLAQLGSLEERRAQAAELLEKALDADPDSIPVAGRLATVRTEDGQMNRLIEVFRAALRRASSPESVVMLGSEIAQIARAELGDLMTAVDAMRRVREVAPAHVRSLLTLSELYIAQRAWPEAVDVLEAIVAHGGADPGARLTALFALASVYERVFPKPDEVERVFRAALGVDPSSARALRGLAKLLRERGGESAEAELVRVLERLGAVETPPEQRQAVLLDLSERKAKAGDRAGAERALIEAAALAPNAELLSRLGRFHEGQEKGSFARALGQVVARGQEIGRADPFWLATLGKLEIDGAGRLEDGIAHLRSAVQMAPSMHEARFHLAQALARSGAGEEASQSLLGMVTPDPRPLLALQDPLAALDVLERLLAGERRSEEALVVRELRALGGALDEGSKMWLRQRRIASDESQTEPLDRATIVGQILPPEGRHVLLDVAAAVLGIEGKVLRSNVGELGLSGRERVSPRSGIPLRAMFDRTMRALRVEEAELVVSSQVTFTRVMVQDVPWVVVPSAIDGRPDGVQRAALARAMTRIALGVPWLEDLPPLHVQAYLVACARQVAPDFAADVRDRQLIELITDYEPRVARAMGRRQKRQLTEIVPQIESATTPTTAEVEAMIAAAVRAELRVAFLVTGDLLAVIDDVRALDGPFARASSASDARALATVLTHGIAGDLTRFALARETTALRWRTGSTWGGR